MALVNCPECGRQVSDSAATCPQCGFGVAHYLERQREIQNIQNEAAEEAYKETKRIMKARAEEAEREAARELERKEAIYQNAINRFNSDKPDDVLASKQIFASVYDYKDASGYYNLCDNRYIQVKSIFDKNNAEAQRKSEEKRRRLAKIMPVVLGFVLLLAIITVVLKTRVLPNSKYNKAVNLYNEGNYKEAIGLFEEIKGYLDSDSYLEKAKEYNTYDKVQNLSTSESLLFGLYEQDGNMENGPEPIEWTVLKRSEDKYLVISKFALDKQVYNVDHSTTFWDTCYLREWLNSDFYNAAFVSYEKNCIQLSQVESNLAVSGMTTEDYLFALSSEEAKTLFNDDNDRECYYALDAYQNNGRPCRWWLRTRARENMEMYIDAAGKIRETGLDYTSDTTYVRPAMWLQVKK